MADSKQLLNELKDGLKIDVNNLDIELVDQPNRFFHAGQQYSLAVSRRDRKDTELDILKAVLDKEIREDADANGDKITEAQIKAAIQRDKEHRQLTKQYLDAKQEAEEWQSLRDSYQQRSYVLKDLVALHISGYFGDVTGARERKDARDRVIERQKE